jgi:hypothetical protein
MEEETRDEIIDIINHEEEIVKEEIVKEEIVKQEEIKPKAKPRPSRAKPKVKISKEPVEPIVVEEAIVEVVEPPKKVDKLKEIVECPDCKMKMTVHTLKYIHKRRGFCKAEVVPEKTPEPIVQQQQQPKPITDDTVNDYIKQNPDVVTNYLRNERILKAQKKQSHARILLNNAF